MFTGTAQAWIECQLTATNTVTNQVVYSSQPLRQEAGGDTQETTDSSGNIPLDIPVRWTITINRAAENTLCGRDYYVEMKAKRPITYDRSLTDQYKFTSGTNCEGNEGTVNFTKTLQAEDLYDRVTYEPLNPLGIFQVPGQIIAPDIDLGAGPSVETSLVRVFPFFVKFAERDTTSADDEICVFNFDSVTIEKVREQEDLGRCTYTEACDGAAARIRSCVGKLRADNVCVNDPELNKNENCTACFSCTNICRPGCSDDPNSEWYTKACVGATHKCGNGKCEAGEGLTAGGGTELCVEDCKNRGTYELCNQILNDDQRSACEDCSSNNNGIWSAVGCINVQPSNIVGSLVSIGLSIGGGVSMLMILAAGFTFSTSQGDPKKLGQAKEMMTSAIVGLLFIVFSVSILQFIGVSILRIPGFGE